MNPSENLSGGDSPDQPVILLLDDDSRLREFLGELLQEKLGAKIVEAAGGLTAISILRTNRIDLIITDLNHWGPSADEVIREVRSLNHLRKTKVLLLTAGSKDRAMAVHGFDCYLQLPGDPATILSTVKRLLTA